MDPALEKAIENVDKAIDRVEISLQEEENMVNIRAAIQRFDFLFQLYWRLLKRALGSKGTELENVEQVVALSGAEGMLSDKGIWEKLIQDDDAISGKFNEATGQRVYNDIKLYFPELKATLSLVKSKCN